jgi:PqqD family protein of HPr-rel-A system
LLSCTGTDSRTTPPHPETWRIAPGQALRRREWQGEHVLYNDLSGDTHLLPDSTVHLLLALQQAPATAPALAVILSAEFEDDDGEIDAAAVQALLAELAALALVEALP